MPFPSLPSMYLRVDSSNEKILLHVDDERRKAHQIPLRRLAHMAEKQAMTIDVFDHEASETVVSVR
jgi:hypothetical protein